MRSGKQIQLPCNRSCECDTKTFAPICTSTGQTYFSACHAGCTNLTYLASETGAAGPGLGDQQVIVINCEGAASDVNSLLIV
jgi:Kazal-type serine protease inhibitor domain